MNVVLLSNEYPPFIFGGQGAFVRDLAFGLNKLGLRVTVLAGYPVPRLRMKSMCHNFEESKAGITVIRFPYPNIPPRHTTFQLLNLRRLSRTVADVDADLIHGQCGSTYPALLTLRGLAPILMTYHGSLKTVRNLAIRGGNLTDVFTYVLGYPPWNYSFKKEYQNCNAAVAVSHTVMKQLILEMNWANDGKMHYIHNGVDLEMLNRVESTAPPRRDGSDPTLLFGGRLFFGKGVLRLLSLARVLKQTYHLDMKIIVYGSGPLYKQIKQQAHKDSLGNVILKDFAGRAQFLQAVKDATFVVLPSYFEASPMFLLESMCMWKIPFMFDLQYSREFTEDGKYGVLARDVGDMAAKINEVYRQDDLENFEKRIRGFAREHYDIRRTAAKYFDLYREISTER
jgi:glycosyltransferase involved in cell wall biosynthesis